MCCHLSQHSALQVFIRCSAVLSEAKGAPTSYIYAEADAVRAGLEYAEGVCESQVVEDGGAKRLIALLKAGPNHPVTPHAARALQALACRHPSAQVSKEQPLSGFLLNYTPRT